MKGPLRIRAVLLDAVGTLIQTREPVGWSYARLARRGGVEVPADRLDEAFRRVLRQAPPMVFPDAPSECIASLEREWWRERVRATFRAADAEARFVDFDAFFATVYEHFGTARAWLVAAGAFEALRALHRDERRVGVLSNSDRRLLGLLDELALSRWLHCVVLPSEARAAKPDARIFHLALERLAARPEEAVYAGDDPEQDLRAARQAGLHGIDARSLATLAELPDRISSLEEKPS